MTDKAVATPRVKKFVRGTIHAFRQTEGGLILFMDTGATDINDAIKLTQNEAIKQQVAGKFQFRCDYLRATDRQPIVLDIAQQTEFKATV